MIEVGTLSLTPGMEQFSWHQWAKGETRLMVVPRWKRKAWLNGDNVIRTSEAHGLTADSYVSWKDAGKWIFAKITEADEWDLRLDVRGRLPDPDTPIHEARPLTGPNLPPDVETVGLVHEELAADDIEDALAADMVDHQTPTLPNIVSTGPGGLDPLAPIPDIFGKLPEVGSFIVPTPMLPMDLVKAAVKLLLKMGVMIKPSTGEPVFEFIPPADLALDIFNLVKDSESVAWESANEGAVKQAIQNALELPGGEETVLFKRVKQSVLNKAPFLVVPKNPSIKAIVAEPDPRYVFEGSSGKVESGDWVVARFSDGLRALRVRAVRNLTGGDSFETFSLSFDALVGNEGELQMVFGEFRGELEPAGADVNTEAVDPEEIELDSLPGSLKRGRRVLLTAEGECDPVEATVVEVGDHSIRTEPPPNDCFKKGNLVIRGNVVAAGHGAAKPTRRLSSGAASSGIQSLLLDVENVSSIPDPTFPRGVRPDVVVTVENMKWTQVPSLHQSSPTDPHYAVRATEDGFLRLVFGDGAHGRRLPTGSNNVQVGYRVGAGRGGNLPPDSLTKPTHPHRLVAEIRQFGASVGGEAMESVEQVQENAPATLLALERAVSLVDFENLAASRNDVWQARAFHRPAASNFLDRITVVVIPAGGGDVDAVFSESVETFLSRHALPTVSVRVVGFSRQTVRLEISIRVDTERYEFNPVLERLRAALGDAFQLERRRIGEPFYLSEVFHVVENVEGVVDSQCRFTDDPARFVPPDTPDQVVYFGGDPDDLTLHVEEYLP